MCDVPFRSLTVADLLTVLLLMLRTKECRRACASAPPPLRLQSLMTSRKMSFVAAFEVSTSAKQWAALVGRKYVGNQHKTRAEARRRRRCKGGRQRNC